MLHGKVPQAIGEYLKIIKSDPNDVLTLNTIGDLYLRQGNSHEANKYFSQVAENYVSNNFFLKAIAVYKKILNADPDNLGINATMASLYAKQGLSIDARNQYLRVAALLQKNGNFKELAGVYEKIVELNPANSAVQQKLAELYLSQGDKEKSYQYWMGAASAQAKAGDLAAAVDSFGQALQLNPLDIEAMKGFSDCCLKLNNPAPALDRLKISVESAPENLELREMLGKAYLANNDLEKAAKVFQIIVSLDESRYENLFEVANAWIRRREYDQALGCLDNIIPILISKHETERAIRFYQQVLQLYPGCLPAMTRMASIYSATGDQVRYLEELDKIADHCVEKKDSINAVDYLEKILQSNPESEKHLKLHREVFAKAYPDVPYKPPVMPAESCVLPVAEPSVEEKKSASSDQGGPSELVEVDLLINYGLRDKAQSLLLNLAERDPYDKQVRLRLLSFYKGEKKFSDAADQCLLLAALYRRLKDEDAAQKYLNEAKQASPVLLCTKRIWTPLRAATALRRNLHPVPRPLLVDARRNRKSIFRQIFWIYLSRETRSRLKKKMIFCDRKERMTQSRNPSLKALPRSHPQRTFRNNFRKWISTSGWDSMMRRRQNSTKLPKSILTIPN